MFIEMNNHANSLLARPIAIDSTRARGVGWVLLGEGMGMRKVLLTAAVAVWVAVSPSPARADTIDVFSVSGTDQYWTGQTVFPANGGLPGVPVYQSGTIGGSLSIDITTSTVLSANVTTPGALVYTDWVLSSPSTVSSINNFQLTLGGFPPANNATPPVPLILSIAGLLLTGSSGGPSCPGDDGCGLFVTSLSGTLTEVSSTPLPTTLPLFATGLGLIGMLAWYRRRQAAIT